MDIKYQKHIRQLIKEEEKWKNEALKLLEQNHYENPCQHPSILKFDVKINNLQNELLSFNQNSLYYQSFLHRYKPSVNNKILPTVKQTFQYKNEDRWADVKIQNAMKREWNWLCKIDNNMPNYMKENLKNMPNNKGYIWKGIYYFGHQSPEQPLHIKTFFEKQNQKLLIHEYSPLYYRIFEKNDKNKAKNLIFEKLYR